MEKPNFTEETITNRSAEEVFEKPQIHDRGFENATLKQIESTNKKLIETAEAQLEIIQASLFDLTERIKTENPEYVVFLDKGTRLLATPIRKYLQERAVTIPKFIFFNDGEVKDEYLNNNLDLIKKIAEERYSQFRGKKVFFVDETFSAGTGSIVRKMMADHLDLDAKFFALTVDLAPQAIVRAEKFFKKPSHMGDVPMGQHFSRLEKVSKDSRFITYQNFIDFLFTKEAASLYVVDNENIEDEVSTLPRYSSDASPDPRKVAVRKEALSFVEGLTIEERDQKVREMNLTTVTKLKDMIYNALVEEAEKQGKSEA